MIRVNKDWTLFLDRDGVINVERSNDYVYHAEQFIFYDGVKEVLAACAHIFSKIIVVTNQRGIGRGLMTTSDLLNVHDFMLREIVDADGRIDKIYFAPDLHDHAPNRKPNTGMAKQAKLDFTEIDFHKSIMVGNNLSDMEFGKRMNMKTVFVRTTKMHSAEEELLIDYDITDLSHLFDILELTGGPMNI